MMMGYSYGYGGPLTWLGMGFGMIIQLAFTALVILAVVWMYKAVFRNGNRTEGRNGALEILQTRYAKGEITREEYQQIKKELKE
ncbi:Hypothetical protein LUCI_4240 [Lucifera butyrica]|uniref:SHOCT domain-containing protein n=1 Tax=Lucifera butyrica TaxID=1351585 RepID=A0A498RBS5_9FIRM|nr:SHOCT domain-containing protein [Lucifera butyrica]VBB08954.1 Hypothetical protein LUCI_4240 [Lucifera butyrica]